MNVRSPKKRVLNLVKEVGMLRPRDLDPLGIPREYLHLLSREGLLERATRGIYVLSKAKPTERHTLAQACKLVPKGVVCLLSALQFHGLTTQIPFEVWMALGNKAWIPKIEYPRLRIVRYSKLSMETGVQEHRIEGVQVKVFSPAKTVADCFKFRNKIGTDVAIEALRDCWKKRRATRNQLWEAAQVCRVANVMRPYLESIT